MSLSEIFGLVFGGLGLLSTTIISIITVMHFNRKPIIYEIKKNAIFRSLKFLDDYLSQVKWIDETVNPVIKENLSIEYLTIEARECYNELILTCKNAEILTLFKKMVFSSVYNEDGIFNVSFLHDYRMLCRKELGIKSIDLDKKIIIIYSVGRKLKN